MTDTTGKITAIFTSGWMDSADGDSLKSAKKLYPSTARLFNGTSISVDGFQSFPSAYDPLRFWKRLTEEVQGQKTGDILHFVHLGHSSPKQISVIASFEIFAKFFGQNIDLKNPPYWAVILGGCWTSNTANEFLKQKTQPDFFYGASALGSYGFVMNFFDEKAEDRNGDGVVTLRERGVYDANKRNPLAVMYSKRGSPDIDIAGNPAKKPFFPREVQSIEDHWKLIDALRSLVFGEQMVVYIPGRPKESAGDKSEITSLDKQKHDWFVREAKEGDGFYKFVEVTGNERNWNFFNMKDGDESAIFVMGSNIRYRGEKLEFFKPIGDQIPLVLANEKILLVLSSWWPHSIMHKSYTSDYFKGLQEEQENFVKKEIEDAFRDGKSILDATIDGIEMFAFGVSRDVFRDKKWTKDMFERWMDRIHYLMKHDDSIRGSFDVVLFNCVELIVAMYGDKKKEMKKEFEDLFVKTFDEFKFNAINMDSTSGISKHWRNVCHDDWWDEINNPDPEIKRRALISLAFFADRERVSDDVRRQILLGPLVDKNNVELRRAAAFFIARSERFKRHRHANGHVTDNYSLSEEDTKVRMLQFINEDDPLTKTLLAFDMAITATEVVCDNNWIILTPFIREAERLAWDTKVNKDLRKLSQNIVLDARIECKLPETPADLKPKIDWFASHPKPEAKARALVRLSQMVSDNKCFIQSPDSNLGVSTSQIAPELIRLYDSVDQFSKMTDLTDYEKMSVDYFYQEWRRSCLNQKTTGPEIINFGNGQISKHQWQWQKEKQE